MRRFLFVTTLGILVSSVSIAQDEKETIEASGKVVTRDVTVQSFNEIEASGLYELKLTQGNTEAVKIEADENLQQYFTVSNEGSKLVIDTKKLKNKNIKGKPRLRVYVTFKKLKGIEISTVGNVQSENQLAFDDFELKSKSVGKVNLKLTANKINVDNKGVGDLELTGKAENAVVKNKGVGALEASDFIVQTMDIENSGVGSASVNAQKSLKVKDSFLGKVSNKGAAPLRKMNKVSI